MRGPLIEQLAPKICFPGEGLPEIRSAQSSGKRRSKLAQWRSPGKNDPHDRHRFWRKQGLMMEWLFKHFILF